MTDIKKNDKPVQDVVGSTLDRATASIQRAERTLANLNVKDAVVAAESQGASVEVLSDITRDITNAKNMLAEANCAVTCAHAKAIELTKDNSNNMVARHR